MTEKKAESLRRQQYVVFQIDNEEFGVEILQTKEIHPYTKITRVPNAPHFVKGVINIRGEIIPVVDLRDRFGLKKSEIQKNTRIITVLVRDYEVGLLVDSVKEVLWIDDSAIEPPPSVAGGIEKEYLKGVGKIGDRLIVLLNIEKILNLEMPNVTDEVQVS
ncbi:hypothetical protein BBF96_02540 [Anoxybacter fermentans]|uniref:Chemotaxis protein CheW n=1 Tax=Anoxybacter fermentans TaxID=1323375 RepID=A0A3Q9HNY3_9FIRM|nr:chemotaxis protein CheW [Anoxybacter fermentans]AZR72368.1 hypothetical protein BBF96_02540 [Anoxybacter fermentans]